MIIRKVVIIAGLSFLLGATGYAQAPDISSKRSVCDNLMATGQLETALKCYLEIEAAKPGDPEANLRISKILEATGKVDQIGPYISRIDSSSAEAAAFLELLKNNYGTLLINCDGAKSCFRYFSAYPKIEFAPPAPLQGGAAIRLAALNAAYASRRELSFHKTGANAYQADIPFFPVLTGAPIPYNVTISNQTYSLDFNFLQRGTLDLSANKLDSVACKIPDGIVEVQLETDDPDFDAILAESSAREGFEIEQGRYYLSEGQSPRLEFQKKDKPQLGKNYFVVTSIILTSALILLQR